MNTLKNSRLQKLTLFVFACSLLGQYKAQAGQTELKAETNGVLVSVEVWASFHQTIQVYILPNPDTNGDVFVNPKFLQNTNLYKIHGSSWPRWMYFMPTNSFCGPIELHDKAGRKIPLLRPSLSSAETYPTNYSLSLMADILMRGRNGVYSGPELPRGLDGLRMTVASLQLQDFFKLKESGEYQLTIWPKIYKRVAPDADLCQRIDFTPITVTINWESQSSK